METNNTTTATNALDFSLLTGLPTGGMAPLAATREQSIADSVERAAEFQKAFPGVDFKSAVIEPTINLTFDLEEKLDPTVYDTHQRLVADIIKHLSPSSSGERSVDDSEVAAEKSMAKAQEAFWEARKCLERHDDLLRQFDAVYLREDRPLGVMFAQLREAFTLQAKMRAALSAAEVSLQDIGVERWGKGGHDDSKEVS